MKVLKYERWLFYGVVRVCVYGIRGIGGGISIKINQIVHFLEHILKTGGNRCQCEQ